MKYLIFLSLFLFPSCVEKAPVKKYYGFIAHGAGNIKCERLVEGTTLKGCSGWAGETIYNAANIYTFEQ